MIIKSINGTQKEAKAPEIPVRQTGEVLHYDIAYDTCHPEETVREFVAKMKEAVSRYEGNLNRIAQIEQELNDLCHYIEIAPFKTVPNGYRLYRKLAELRRERRACKNENDLLKPLWELFRTTSILDKLSSAQGACATAKTAIDARVYTIRTDILNEWIEPAKKPDEEEAPQKPELKVVI